MKKLILRFKHWFKEWVLSEEFEKLDDMIKSHGKMMDDLVKKKTDFEFSQIANEKRFKDESFILEGKLEKFKSMEKNLERIWGNTQIASDIDAGYGGRYGSWAVVCVRGKSENYVKFLDLSLNDVREVHGFLKCFEKDSRIDDAPRFMMRKGYLKF